MCVCLLVCWSAFYRPHDICPICGAASDWPREQEPSSRAAPRARAQACTARESTRAHAVQLLNEKIVRCADAFQKQNRTRARMLSYYSLPSLGVFTFRIVLNRTRSLVGADLGQLVYTYKRVVCVCLLVFLLVCWSAFYRPHDICPLCGAASEYSERAAKPSRAAPRARRGQACTCSAENTRMPYNCFSTKKSLR